MIFQGCGRSNGDVIGVLGVLDPVSRPFRWGFVGCNRGAEIFEYAASAIHGNRVSCKG